MKPIALSEIIQILEYTCRMILIDEKERTLEATELRFYANIELKTSLLIICLVY